MMALVLQRFAIIAVSHHDQLDLRFVNRSLAAFYPQDLVAVIKIEVDLVIRETPLQEETDMAGRQQILYVGLEDLDSHNRR